jgi:uncharacterized protein YlxW (UPF0749 family)
MPSDTTVKIKTHQKENDDALSELTEGVDRLRKSTDRLQTDISGLNKTARRVRKSCPMLEAVKEEKKP